MRIGIDVDGVLTDINQWIIDYGSKMIFEKYNREIENKDAYEFIDMFNVDIKVEKDFWEEYFFEYAKNEPPRKFASEIINKLKEDNEIYIITARLSDFEKEGQEENKQKMKDVVIKWFKEYDIPYDEIIFTSESKLKICIEKGIDVMIEDNVDNINSISKSIPVICFDARYNRECTGKNIIRCYSWYDIYGKLKNLKDNMLKAGV